jgi:hypothetical protein
MTIAQDFELPVIKLNKDKVEVTPTVSQTPPADLVTQLSAISDRFERAFNNQNSLVASVATRLEKIEGKRVINNVIDDNIPQVDSQGVMHSTTSAAQESSPEAPVYGMPTGFYPGQLPSPKLTPIKSPPRMVHRPVWPDGYSPKLAIAFVSCAYYTGSELK